MDNDMRRCGCDMRPRMMRDAVIGCPPPEPAMALTMAYVPFQGCDSEQYCADKALMRGTLYKDLDKPFMGSRRRMQ